MASVYYCFNLIIIIAQIISRRLTHFLFLTNAIYVKVYNYLCYSLLLSPQVGFHTYVQRVGHCCVVLIYYLVICWTWLFRVIKDDKKYILYLISIKTITKNYSVFPLLLNISMLNLRSAPISWYCIAHTHKYLFAMYYTHFNTFWVNCDCI